MTGVSAAAKSARVPVPDQQTALALLLELAVQRGSLHHLLKTLLLLSLWNNSRHASDDNRFTTNLTSAPLVPLLQRFQAMQTTRNMFDLPKWDEVSAEWMCYV